MDTKRTKPPQGAREQLLSPPSWNQAQPAATPLRRYMNHPKLLIDGVVYNTMRGFPRALIENDADDPDVINLWLCTKDGGLNDPIKFRRIRNPPPSSTAPASAAKESSHE
jgi:hypothetical protein